MFDVKMCYALEWNQIITVRPNGKTSLQPIREVEAVGLTAPGLVKEPATVEEVMQQSFDIIDVPRGAISNVYEFIDRYVDKVFLMPVSRIVGFGFAYPLNAISVPETGR